MNSFIKKVITSLIIIGSLAHGELVCSIFKAHSQSLKADSAIKFDFIVALDEGDLRGVQRCLEAGFDVNEQWANKETPLMYAIRKLAALEEPQEVGVIDGAYLLGSSLLLAGGYYLCTRNKDTALRAGTIIKNMLEKNTLPTKREWQQVGLVAAVGLGLGIGSYLAVSTLYYKSKHLMQYLYYRWKISAARLGIIELLIHHPAIDLSLANANPVDGKGQTALDLVHELRHHAQSSHIARLLDTVELMIIERMHN